MTGCTTPDSPKPSPESYAAARDIGGRTYVPASEATPEQRAAAERQAALESGDSGLIYTIPEEAQPKASAYAQTLRKRVGPHFAAPGELAGKPLRTNLTISVDDLGRLSSVLIELPSGDSGFDALAVKAVRAAVPFPVPPKELVGVPFLLSFTP